MFIRKKYRYQKISHYEDKIKELEAAKEAAERKEKERIAKEKAQMRFNEYWAEHAEEKENLEKERADLNEQISEFNQEIIRIVGEEEIQQKIIPLQNRVNDITTELTKAR